MSEDHEGGTCSCRKPVIPWIPRHDAQGRVISDQEEATPEG
jgi:hypothetical protein